MCPKVQRSNALVKTTQVCCVQLKLSRYSCGIIDVLSIVSVGETGTTHSRLVVKYFHVKLPVKIVSNKNGN